MPDNPNPQQQQPDPMLTAIQSRTAASSQQQAPSGQVSADPMLDAVVARQRAREAGEAAKWTPSENDMVAEIQTLDGQPHLIHADDLAEAKRRDPNIKVVSQPQTYRDYARGRTLENMTRAMSGQPMARPEDQAEAERGRRAGTIAGGAQIATGALGGLFTPGLQAAEETSSLLGPGGQPIVKQVIKEAPSLAAKTGSTVVDKAQTVAQWTKANPIKAVAIEALAHELGVDPFQLLSKVVKYGKHLFE